MTDDRLAKILQLCQDALAREGAERRAWLDAACGSDADLRRDVEALLLEQDRTDGILDTPPWATPQPALETGQRLGPYQITGELGAGGMGAVYSARDTRLGRTVALKVLAGGGALDSASRERFTREARAIAALSHPHICVLYDVGREGDIDYLVMEHLEGETLAARLMKGAMPLDDVLRTGTEIADALAAAHHAGIIHRDLKPANVMLTKTGAKLLDFGLAKWRTRPHPGSTGSSTPSSQHGPPTAKGTMLGTIAYMAPEQLEGREADARSDLFALGCVLYEMLTGRRAFAGDTEAKVISAIMSNEPAPASSLEHAVPPGLDRLIRGCLAKDPADRWESAHDLADELRWIKDAGTTGAPATEPGRSRARTWMVIGIAGAALLVLAGVAALWPHQQSGTSMVGLALDVHPADELNAGGARARNPVSGGSRTAFAWTPDGGSLIFAGRRAGVQQLYVRRLDAAGAVPIPGTEGAQVPAVSPDGEWVAFWTPNAIRKIRLRDGQLIELMTGVVQPPYGMTWSTRGELFFGAHKRGIWVIRPAGPPEAVSHVGDAEQGHVLPWPTPDGRAVLYTVRKRVMTWGDEAVVVQVLPGGPRKVLLADATDARIVSTGHLVFLRRGTLFAVPFDADRLELRGVPVEVLGPVAQALRGTNGADVTGAGQFAISSKGTLAWLRPSTAPAPSRSLVTVDRHGVVTPLNMPARDYFSVHVSPDGHRLVVNLQDTNERSLWIVDLDRGGLVPLVRDGESSYPVWSPDGRRIVFQWLDGGRRSLAELPADSSGNKRPRVLLPASYVVPSSFAQGDRLVAVRDESEIVTVAVDGGQAGIESPGRSGIQQWPDVSSDGRWLLYGARVLSNQTQAASTQTEIYVQRYPGEGPALPVSVGGGSNPAWNPNGRELFYSQVLDAGRSFRMMAVDFTPGSPPRIGSPRHLFDYDLDLWLNCSLLKCFSVAPDGQRFYTIQNVKQPATPPVTHVNIVPNWLDEVKAKAR